MSLSFCDDQRAPKRYELILMTWVVVLSRECRSYDVSLPSPGTTFPDCVARRKIDRNRIAK